MLGSLRGYLALLIPFYMFVSAAAQERQVPVDSAGKITVIDAPLEKKLSLFPEVQGFYEARLYQLSDTSFALEIYRDEMGGRIRDRRMMTAEEVRIFRSEVSSRTEISAPEAFYEQSGRARLIGGYTMVSLGYYGWAVPVMLDIGSASGVTATYLVTGAAGILIPYFATQRANVSNAATTLSLYGATRGIAHGIAFGFLIGGDEPNGRGILALSVLFSVGEGLGGYSLAESENYANGTAWTMSVCGDLGLLSGLAGAHTIGLFEDGNHDVEVSRARGTMAMILTGSIAGLAYGRHINHDNSFSAGDGRVLRSFWINGAAIPLAILDISGVEEARTYSAVAIAGALGGLIYGQHSLRNKDFSSSQGTIITLVQAGGALFGLGVAYIIDPDTKDSGLFTGLATASGTTAFALMYRAQSAHTRRHSFLDISVSPELVMNGQKAVPGLGMQVNF